MTVNRDAVEAARLGGDMLLEICDEAGNIPRHSEESRGKVKADRVVVDDGHAFARASPHRREVPAAAAKQEFLASVKKASIIFTYGSRRR